MQHSLATCSIECARLFNHVSNLLHDAACESRTALAQIAVEDQSSRFRLWAGNLGAFLRPPSLASLDHRLRESPKVALQIQGLLEDLQDSLHAITEIAAGERPNRQYGSESGDSDISNDGISDEGPGEDLSSHRVDRSEAEELFETVKETIASLFRISIFIRNASPRDRFERALSARNDAFIETFDVGHVGAKFPLLQAEDKLWLRDRLGRAITQRRQFLRYSRDHRDKLSREPRELWKPEVSQPVMVTAMNTGWGAISQAERPSTARPTSTVAPTTASTLFLDEIPSAEADIPDDQSQTSYAPSMADEEEEAQLQLPRLDDVSKGRSTFQCQLCCTILTIKKEKAWKKHVFSDLRPYVCTFEKCDFKLFADRAAWFDHELQHHRARWQCPFCNQDKPYRAQSREAFQRHLLQQHAQFASEDQLDALSEASLQPLEEIPALDCPFCQEWEAKLRERSPGIKSEEILSVTPAQFRRHVGAHMQQLALFALPRGYLENDADSDSAASDVAAGGIEPDTDNAESKAKSVESTDASESVYSRTLSEHERIQTFDAAAFVQQLAGLIYSGRYDADKAWTRVLPNLLQEEIEMLRTHPGFTSLPWPSLFSNSPFNLLLIATIHGRYGSEAYWLARASRFENKRVWLGTTVPGIRGISLAELELIDLRLRELGSYSSVVDCLQCELGEWSRDLVEYLARDNNSRPNTSIDWKALVNAVRQTKDIGMSPEEMVFDDNIFQDWVDNVLQTYRLSSPAGSLISELSGPDVELTCLLISLWQPETRLARVKVLRAVIDLNELHRSPDLLVSTIIRLHWNRRALREAKRLYQQLYGQTVQSKIADSSFEQDFKNYLLALLNADESSITLGGMEIEGEKSAASRPPDEAHLELPEDPGDYIDAPFSHSSGQSLPGKFQKGDQVHMPIFVNGRPMTNVFTIQEYRYNVYRTFWEYKDNRGFWIRENDLRPVPEESDKDLKTESQTYSDPKNPVTQFSKRIEHDSAIDRFRKAMMDCPNSRAELASKLLETMAPADKDVILFGSQEDLNGICIAAQLGDISLAEELLKHGASLRYMPEPYGEVDEYTIWTEISLANALTAGSEMATRELKWCLILFSSILPTDSNANMRPLRFDFILEGIVASDLSLELKMMAARCSHHVDVVRRAHAGRSQPEAIWEELRRSIEYRLDLIIDSAFKAWTTGELAFQVSLVNEHYSFAVFLIQHSIMRLEIEHWGNFSHEDISRRLTTAMFHSALTASNLGNLEARYNSVQAILATFQNKAYSSKLLNHDGCYGMLVAARSNDFALAELLVQFGADIYHATRDGNTPLLEALKHSHQQFVSWLMEHAVQDTNVTEKSIGSLQPYWYLYQMKKSKGYDWFDLLDRRQAISGRLGTVQSVLEHWICDACRDYGPVTIRMSCSEQCSGPLAYSGKYHHDDIPCCFEVAQALLREGEQPGLSALEIAAWQNDIDLARILLRYSVPSNSALQLAVGCNHPRFVQCLFEHGLNKPSIAESLASTYASMRNILRQERQVEGLPTLAGLEFDDWHSSNISLDRFIGIIVPEAGIFPGAENSGSSGKGEHQSSRPPGSGSD